MPPGIFTGERRRYEGSLPLLRAAGRELDLARALDRAGMAARQLMELADAQALHTRALEIQRRAGPPAERALCLNNLGVVAFFRGDLDSARAYHQEALALRQQAGDIRGQASSLNNLGQIDRFAGALNVACASMEQGLALRRQLGDRWGVAGSQVNLAAVHTRLGNLVVARAHLREAAAGFRAVGDPLGGCECLEAAAELAHADNRSTDAGGRLSGRGAGGVCEQLPAPRSPLLEQTVAEELAELRRALGEEVFRAAWRDGHETGEAILEALPFSA